MPAWLNRSTSLGLAVVMVAAALTIGAAHPSSARADMSFKLTGGGWGHGIGLSQYGAQGYALKGWPYSDILRWYYGGDRDGSSTGMRVATLSSIGMYANPQVQVNLDKTDASRTSWTLRGFNARLKVSDDTTTTYLARDVYYTFRVSGGKVSVNGKTYVGTVTAQAEGGTSLVVVKDASGPFSYPYVRYRGRMRLSVSGSGLRLLNMLPMEHYLYGVVPRESPASWNAEALKAQAVAARSYAWASNPSTSPSSTVLPGILHCTTYSQVYGGHSRLISGSDSNVSMHEDDRTTAAVSVTYGQVMYHDPTDKVIVTYFFSSSGGKTANIEDVWGSAPRVYYRSVVDADEASSYFSWAPETRTGASLAAAIRDKDNGASDTDALDYSSPSPATVIGFSFDRAASGHVRSANVTWSDGKSYRVGGDTLRSALGLKSTKFYLSKLSFGTRFQDTDSRIAYACTWTVYRASMLSGGSYRYASKTGAQSYVAFKGTGFRWFAPRYKSGGRADVYLDGVRQTTVSLYSTSTKYNSAIWTATGLSPDTTHTVAIRVLGKKDAASSGTNVGLDAVEIEGGSLLKATVPVSSNATRFQESAPALKYTGTWTRYSNASLSGGAYVWSSSASASAETTFSGNRIRWVSAKCKSFGDAIVYLDGKPGVRVSLYGPELKYLQVIWDSGTIPAGTHTLKIAPLGMKAPSSIGYAVGIDCIDVWGSLVNR